MKCFIDANVLFSGANETSQMHRLLQTFGARHELITSDYAREEAIRNIRTKRARWEFGFNQIMRSIAIVPSIDQMLDIEIASKDRPILATAIANRCDRLITGDKKDFGHLFEKEFQGVIILSPLMWIQELTS
jgi:predicted nucleic acid-binding protein